MRKKKRDVWKRMKIIDMIMEIMVKQTEQAIKRKIPKFYLNHLLYKLLKLDHLKK